jgi:hypothetical protein
MVEPRDRVIDGPDERLSDDAIRLDPVADEARLLRGVGASPRRIDQEGPEADLRK